MSTGYDVIAFDFPVFGDSPALPAGMLTDQTPFICLTLASSAAPAHHVQPCIGTHAWSGTRSRSRAF
jgi:hypothetical protein